MGRAAIDIAAFIGALIAALLVTPLLIGISHRIGLLDLPDGKRKRHTLPVPRVGGAAILLSLLCGVWLAFFQPVPIQAAGFALAVAVVFFVGAVDDIMSLSATHKLLAETGAAALAVVAGVRLGSDPKALLLTVGWLVLCTNAFNLLDGIDGLAPAVGVLAAVAMLAMGSPAAAILIPLAGSLAGVLWFNRPPAKVFLGDSGSLSVGFLLGCAAVLTAQGSPQRLIGPAIALLLPLLDTAWTVVRRSLKGQELFTADKDHIHHRVLALVNSPTQALVYLTVFSAGTSVVAVAVHSWTRTNP